MKVVEVIDSHDCVVELPDSTRVIVGISNLEAGVYGRNYSNCISFYKTEYMYEGIIKPILSGELIKVIEYINKRNVLVEFLDSHNQVWTNLESVRTGNLFNPFHRNRFGGYFGVGPYDKKNHKVIYDSWTSMLERGTEIRRQLVPYNEMTYANVSIIPEWFDYQVFADWYYNYKSQLNQNENIQYNLDKDILQYKVTNKIYSPSTCCIVPEEINLCMTYLSMCNNRKTKKHLPVGVNELTGKDKDGKPTEYVRYQINFSSSGHYNYLGSFADPMEAFNAYKEAKEKHIKGLANYYYYEKHAITEQIYHVLMNWVVEPF